MSKFETFIGSFRKTEGAAVVRCVFNSEAGTLTETDRIVTERPSYLTLDKENRVLYCIREAECIDGVPGGGVVSIDVSGDTMRILSKQSTHAGGPSHLCLHDGRLIVSIYGDGALVQFPVCDNRILPVSAIIKHCGHGTDPERQASPHPHYVYLTPDGKYIAVCDLGLDRIFMYPYSRETGIALAAKEIVAPDGLGPRHLLFSDDGTKMYVLTEMGNTLLVYDYRDGEGTLLAALSTLPEGETRHSDAAAIRFTPDHKEIAVSNRGTDTIAFFRLDESGMPVFEGVVETALWPRDFAFTPDGKHLLCADQNSGAVEVYAFACGDAPITERCRKLAGGHLATDNLPCCIVFGKELG